MNGRTPRIVTVSAIKFVSLSSHVMNLMDFHHPENEIVAFAAVVFPVFCFWETFDESLETLTTEWGAKASNETNSMWADMADLTNGLGRDCFNE